MATGTHTVNNSHGRGYAFNPVFVVHFQNLVSSKQPGLQRVVCSSSLQPSMLQQTVLARAMDKQHADRHPPAGPPTAAATATAAPHIVFLDDMHMATGGAGTPAQGKKRSLSTVGV